MPQVELTLCLLCVPPCNILTQRTTEEAQRTTEIIADKDNSEVFGVYVMVFL
jgi:hypothetical protein